MTDKSEIPDIAPDLTEKNGQPNGNKKPNGRRNRITGYVILTFCLLGLMAFVVWWFVFRNHETTDDAYVGGNMVVLTARQPGSVVAYFADDTEFVVEGQLLVTLDPTDYLLNLERKKTSLEIAAREVRELYENVKQREADVQLKNALLRRSWTDYKNRTELVTSEAVSKEDYEHSSADYDAAQASLVLAQHELEAAIVLLGAQELQKHPYIVKAKDEVREAYLGVCRCSIYAPVSGFIAKRAVQAGQSIKASTPLLSIVPLDQVWVDANFKETQLSHMRIGQPVEIVADMYGSKVVYHGKLAGLQAGSGSVFSLLPPQNATGNWIKIVQRVPVRIYFDLEELKKHPLLLGLSVTAKVFVKDRSGLRLADHSVSRPLMQTSVFDIPLDELNVLLDSIVDINLGTNHSDKAS